MNIKKPETATRRIGDFIFVFVLYNIFWKASYVAIYCQHDQLGLIKKGD